MHGFKYFEISENSLIKKEMPENKIHLNWPILIQDSTTVLFKKIKHLHRVQKGLFIWPIKWTFLRSKKFTFILSIPG